MLATLKPWLFPASAGGAVLSLIALCLAIFLWTGRSAAPDTAARPAAPRAIAASRTAPGGEPPAAAVPAPAALPVAGPPAAYSLQVGVFRDKAQANSVAASLAARGYAPVVATGTDSTGLPWMAVRIGAYPDADAAQAGAAILAQRARLAATVVATAGD